MFILYLIFFLINFYFTKMQPNTARMEKQSQNEVDYDDFKQEDETTSFLNTDHIKETTRRKGMTYMLLANLFIFTLSLLTLVCAVYSQRSQSVYSAARLMDEFGVYCMFTGTARQRILM